MNVVRHFRPNRLDQENSKFSQIISGWCMSPWCEKATTVGRWSIGHHETLLVVSYSPAGTQLARRVSLWQQIESTAQFCFDNKWNSLGQWPLVWWFFWRPSLETLILVYHLCPGSFHLKKLSPGWPIVFLCPQNGSAFWLFDWSPTFTWP